MIIFLLYVLSVLLAALIFIAGQPLLAVVFAIAAVLIVNGIAERGLGRIIVGLIVLAVLFGNYNVGTHIQTGYNEVASWINREAPPAPPATEEPKVNATEEPKATEEATNDGSRVCIGDKIATWSEVGAAGPQRIEISVGKNSISHYEIYANRGIDTVSVLVHDNDPYTVLSGFGSAWEWAMRDCGSYDFVNDMTVYAEGRRSLGHSGLIYASLQDYLDNKDPIVNLWGADKEDFRPVFWDEKSGAPAASDVTVTACTAVRKGDADNQTLTIPAGHTYSVEAWSPVQGFALFTENQTMSGVMGALWDYPCGKDAVVADLSGRGTIYVLDANGTLVESK